MPDPCSLQNEAPFATAWIAEGCEKPIPDSVVLEVSELSYQAPERLAALFSPATDAAVVRLVCIYYHIPHFLAATVSALCCSGTSRIFPSTLPSKGDHQRVVFQVPNLLLVAGCMPVVFEPLQVPTTDSDTPARLCVFGGSQ